jgi:hypothetical protein
MIVSSERAAAADDSAIARLARWVEREDARAFNGLSHDHYEAK